MKKHEKEKKRAYNSRIMNVEHGTFTPLVFSLTGGEGQEASIFHKNIIQKISATNEENSSIFHKNIVQKISATNEENYDRVLSLIRGKLSFLICVRESRSVSNDHLHLDDVFFTGTSFCRPCYRTLTCYS